jgi:hypothetical protein
MVNSDNKLILEQYKKIQEGLIDRTKANISSIGGEVRGLKQRIGGHIKGAIAGYNKDDEAYNTAKQEIESGKNLGLDAKTNSIVRSHFKKLRAVIQDFTDDLTELDILSRENARWYNDELMKVIENMTKKETVQNLPVPEKPKIVPRGTAAALEEPAV